MTDKVESSLAALLTNFDELHLLLWDESHCVIKGKTFKISNEDRATHQCHPNKAVQKKPPDFEIHKLLTPRKIRSTSKLIQCQTFNFAKLSLA